MCFSATASFAASLVLIPVGIYCVKHEFDQEKTYRAIALLPLIFGIQQLLEGFVWLDFELEGKDNRLPALGFMFFSHLFWLVWIPFACYVAESSRVKRNIFIIFSAVGAAHGLIMYLPLLFNPEWLVVELVKQSIDYKATLLYDDYIPRIVVRVIYAIIVLIPLLLVSDRYIRIFGVLVAISVLVSTVVFAYAFISIWCYFAAVLSLYIFVMLVHKSRHLARIHNLKGV